MLLFVTFDGRSTIPLPATVVQGIESLAICDPTARSVSGLEAEHAGGRFGRVRIGWLLRNAASRDCGNRGGIPGPGALGRIGVGAHQPDAEVDGVPTVGGAGDARPARPA